MPTRRAIFKPTAKSLFNSLRITATLAFLAWFAAQNLLAQTLDTASVRGQVTDPQGAVIENAGVVLVNQLTGLKRETHTDGDGYYHFAGLPLTGRYTLTISSQGFKTFEQKDLSLRADEAATINVLLSLGAIDSDPHVDIFG